MKTKPSNQRPSWHYTILGILALIFVFKLFFRLIDTVDEQDHAKDFAVVKALQEQKDKSESYAYGIDLEESGIIFLKLENDPYPLFYVSVLDSTVLREDALVPILERLIQKNGVRSEINLGKGWQYSGDNAPAEVKYVMNQDYDHVVAEKVFAIKKDKWGRRLIFEERD